MLLFRAGVSLALMFGATPAWCGDVPLPPPRPAFEAAPVAGPVPRLSDPTPATAETPKSAGVADAACERVRAGGHLEATPVAPVAGAGGCGIAEPVLLKAVMLADGTRVPLQPPALMRCDLAEVLGEWMRDDVALLALAAGGGLAKVLDADAYACRGRNQVAGARLSEHGRGNAFDFTGVVLRDGRTLTVGAGSAAMAAWRATACARFTTVLGPGSDGFHESHLHVDLEARRHGGRICQ